MTILRHHDSRIESLAKSKLFEGLRPGQLKQVASLTTGLRVPAGRTLCERGRRGDEFFLIETGEVRLSNGVTLRDGDFFGEMALVNDAPRSATAVTTQPTNLLVLSRREFQSLRDVDPHIGHTIEAAIRARQVVATAA